MTLEGYPTPRIFGGELAERTHPLVPEVRLGLLAETVDLARNVGAILTATQVPFWPFVWAGGAVLARYVLDHPEAVRGRDVVDFGAGSGIVGIACALVGARRVVCVDLDDHALRACTENAHRNGTRVEVATEVPDAWDLLLAADVLYESDNAEVLALVARPGHALLLCEAHRPGAKRPARAPLATHEAGTLPDVDVGVTRASIYAFEGREAWIEAFGLPPADDASPPEAGQRKPPRAES